MVAKVVILAFIILELSNVLALYFMPGTKKANSVGVFSAWEKSKQYPEIHDFIKYLVNWVAGTKLIFLLLLGVIVLWGNLELQQLSLLALVLATLTFYWRLFPLIRKMDREDQIHPKNYSFVLGGMIFIMILLFGFAALF